MHTAETVSKEYESFGRQCRQGVNEAAIKQGLTPYDDGNDSAFIVGGMSVEIADLRNQLESISRAGRV